MIRKATIDDAERLLEICRGERMIYIINASPRANGNTVKMLQSAQRGAEDAGAETIWTDLYKLNYKGCVSCFACKLNNGKFKNVCIQKDELKPVLEALAHADGMILGTSVYYMNINGATQSFLERLFFPNYEYTDEFTCFPGELPTGFIYTMNMPEDAARSSGLLDTLSISQNFAKTIFRVKPAAVYAFDTKQFTDYSKYPCE